MAKAVIKYECDDNAENSVVTDSTSNAYHGTLLGAGRLASNTSGVHTDGGHYAGKPGGYFAINYFSAVHSGSIGYYSEGVVADDYLARWVGTLRGSFAISFWVRLDDGTPPDGNKALFGYGIYIDGTLYDHIWIKVSTEGNLIARFGIGTGSVEAVAVTQDAVFSDGQTDWYNIFVSADQSINGAYGLSIFVNGELQELAIATAGDTSGAGMLTGWQNWCSTSDAWTSIYSWHGDPPIQSSYLWAGWNCRAWAPLIGNEMVVVGYAATQVVGAPAGSYEVLPGVDIDDFILWDVTNDISAPSWAVRMARWWYNNGQGRDPDESDDNYDDVPDEISPGNRPDFEYDSWTAVEDFRRPRYVF